jgi:FkbM family methyltransferase
MIRMLTRHARSHPWLGRAMIHALPDLAFRINVDPIGPFEIKLRQNRSYWLRSPLAHEGFMLGALRRLISPGDIVYDLGANIGLYARFMSQVFGAGTVIAFEPMPSNTAILERNLALGGCAERVRILPFAIADENGEALFQIDDVSSASGTLDAVTHGDACQARKQYGFPPATTKVAVRTLDAILEQGLPVPQVIKIDIEGAEALALRGARKLLTTYRPHLAIEIHGIQAALDVTNFLLDLNYAVFSNFERKGRRSYQRVRREDLVDVTDQYSLHFLVAAADEKQLEAPVEDYRP